MSPRLQKLYVNAVVTAQQSILRDNQLRNFNYILQQPLPKHKEKRLQPLLAGYQARAEEARGIYHKALDKFQKRAKKEGTVS